MFLPRAISFHEVQVSAFVIVYSDSKETPLVGRRDSQAEMGAVSPASKMKNKKLRVHACI